MYDLPVQWGAYVARLDAESPAVKAGMNVEISLPK